MNCLLCLNFENKMFGEGIRVGSEQWKAENIKHIIEKHLWPMDTEQSSGMVCVSCWEALHAFHSFYLLVKRAHNLFDTIDKSRKVSEITKNISSISETENACKKEYIEVSPENEILIQESIPSVYVIEDIDPLQQVDRETYENHRRNDETVSEEIKNEMNSQQSDCSRNPNCDRENEELNDKESAMPPKPCRQRRKNPDKKTQKIHDKMISRNIKLSCFICKAPLENFVALRRHFRVVHKKRGFVKCCNKKIFCRPQLVDHLNFHLDRSYFKCKHCGRAYSDRYTLDKHMKTRHKKVLAARSHAANESGKSSSADSRQLEHKNLTDPVDIFSGDQEVSKVIVNNSNISLTEHSTLESNMDYEDFSHIKKSGKKFKNPERKTKEENDKIIAKHFRISCTLCVKPFDDFGVLSRHFREKHEQQTFVKCCNKKFFCRPQLVEHLNLHSVSSNFSFDNNTNPMAENSENDIDNPGNDLDKSCVDSTQLKSQNLTNATDDETGSEVITNETNILLNGNNSSRSDTEYEDCNDMRKAITTNGSGKKKRGNPDKKTQEEQDKIIAEHLNVYCTLCLTPFDNFGTLSKHIRKEHKKRAFMICCNKKFFCRPELVDHLNLHLDASCFKCIYCEKVYSHRKTMERHIRRLHPSSENAANFTCTECGELFVNAKQLENHKLSHAPAFNALNPSCENAENLNCTECGKLFMDATQLEDHKLTHAPDYKQKISCNECGKNFLTLYNLKHHIRAIHRNEYAKMCDICGKTIRHSFKLHVEKHYNKLAASVHCDICGLRLNDKRSLREHKSFKHPVGGKRQFSCHICQTVTSSIRAHRNHVRFMHEIGKIHKCTICDKAFNRAEALKEHTATHTGTPLYNCLWCPKTFISSGKMSKHRKNAHPKEYEELKRQKYVDNFSAKAKGVD